MKISDYLEKLNCDSQKVFNQSLFLKDIFGELHNLSSYLFDFSKLVKDNQERKILVTVCTQLESATFSLTLGLYRQAFSSLRLALEMGLAAIYFSAIKLELYEWLIGEMDIKWSKLIDPDNGVLSKRFFKAFFIEIENEAEHYRNSITRVYRKLSEYVHGNNDTWKDVSPNIEYNKEVIDNFREFFKTSVEVILFTATCRYIKSFSPEELESLDFIPEIFNNHTEIRKLFGRS